MESRASAQSTFKRVNVYINSGSKIRSNKILKKLSPTSKRSKIVSIYDDNYADPSIKDVKVFKIIKKDGNFFEVDTTEN